jgi:phage shock protein A
MWRQLLEFGKKLISLAHKSDQHEEDIKALRQEFREMEQALKEMDGRIAALVEIVRHLSFEIERDRQIAARDRENLVLRLELALTRSERRLPPASPESSPTEGEPS